MASTTNARLDCIRNMPDVLNAQNYGISETARMLRVAGTTLHRWSSGWRSKGKLQEPMISPRDGRLSFQDLAELSVVAQLRMHDFSVSAIRNAAAEIRRAKSVERPFLQGVLVGQEWREIFFDHLGALVSTKVRNQVVFSDLARAKLIRPERIMLEDGVALRVFLFSREDRDADPQLVAIDPRYRFGQPVTSPSMIDIDGLVLRFRWGESFDDIAELLRPKQGIPELEEGIRYWLSTMTPAMRRRVDAIPSDRVKHRLAAFRGGVSVDLIARQERVRPKTVESSLSKALEHAFAA